MRKKLRSYTNLYTASPRVCSPSSTCDLNDIYEKATDEKKSISFAAGMSSFDSQFLNDDIVVQMNKFRDISIDQEKRTLTAQAGARWGDVLEKLTPLGLTMPSTVTTKAATVGGTLSGNCLSQTSTYQGKEGHHVLGLKLLPIVGEERTCSATQNPSEFKAVIGGFGWLGAVTEATYKLREIGNKRNIKALLTKHTGFGEIIRVLEESRQKRESDTAWAVVFLHGKHNNGIVFRETYTAETDGKPYFYFQPDRASRMLFEALGTAPGLGGIFTRLSYWATKHNSEYLNTIQDNVFFMDGNRNYKNKMAKLGARIKAAQQTYVTPVDETVEFLERMADQLRENKLIPSAIDTLYVPSDDVLLSSNNGLPGYASTVTYEAIRGKKRLCKIKNQLASLNDLCHELNGRTYLVKNVFINSQQQIQEMYEPHLQSFLAIKKGLDPSSVIRNEFFDRIFESK